MPVVVLLSHWLFFCISVFATAAGVKPVGKTLFLANGATALNNEPMVLVRRALKKHPGLSDLSYLHFREVYVCSFLLVGLLKTDYVCECCWASE